MHWIANNFVKGSTQVLSIDGSRVILSITPESLRKVFNLSLPSQNSAVITFSEEETLATIKALSSEQISSFLSKMLSPEVDQTPSQFLIESTLFVKPIQALFSLMSQILGLESDKNVTEVMIGILCLCSHSSSERSSDFEEFLVARMLYQLENFWSSGNLFRYPTLMMLLLINENKQALDSMEPNFFNRGDKLLQKSTEF